MKRSRQSHFNEKLFFVEEAPEGPIFYPGFYTGKESSGALYMSDNIGFDDVRRFFQNKDLVGNVFFDCVGEEIYKNGRKSWDQRHALYFDDDKDKFEFTLQFGERLVKS